jgi:cbb3-type cytochrome oxidase maturation protein
VSVLFVVVPVVLVLVGGAIAAFVWATHRGQFDDLVTPALRALHDDPPAQTPETTLPDADRSGDASPPGTSIV